MFVPKNRGFKRQYVYGGTGIFDSIASFFTRLFSSNAARQIASTALDVGKEVGKKAVDVGKNVAIDTGKKLIEKGVTKVLTPNSQSILQKYAGVPLQQSSPDAVAKKAQSILSKYINNSATNINSLIDGSGSGAAEGHFVPSCTVQQQKAIAIQDLVKKLNRGSGLKMA